LGVTVSGIEQFKVWRYSEGAERVDNEGEVEKAERDRIGVLEEQVWQEFVQM